MYITSISLTYLFIITAIVFLLFSLYFKIIYVKTSPDNKSRNKIIGSIKDPITWRKKNNIMSYISLFWSFIYTLAFIYFKFFSNAKLVSTIYMFIFAGLTAASFLFVKFGNKTPV